MLTPQEKKDLQRYSQLADGSGFFEAGIKNILNPDNSRTKQAYDRLIEELDKHLRRRSKQEIYDHLQYSPTRITWDTFLEIVDGYNEMSISTYEDLYYHLRKIDGSE